MIGTFAEIGWEGALVGTLALDPHGGFYLTVPHTDAGALFTPNRGSS